MRERSPEQREPVYLRDMPGGGFVAVYASHGGRQQRRRTTAVPEGRGSERAALPAPHPSAHEGGTDLNAVVTELLSVADSNTPLAAVYLRSGPRWLARAAAPSDAALAGQAAVSVAGDP